MDVMGEIQTILSRKLNLKLEEMNPQSGLSTLRGWDSLNHLSIIDEIERHYQISFTGRELVLLNTIEKLNSAVKARLNK